jgi:hypothetical protein
VDFLSEYKQPESTNIIDLYPKFVKNLPLEVPKPSMDQYQYVAAMYFKQKHLDWLRMRLDHAKEQYMKYSNFAEYDLEVNEKEAKSMAKEWDSKVNQLTERIQKETDAILKYTSMGMTRDAPKRIDINTTHSINLQQFNELLKRSDRELKNLENDYSNYKSNQFEDDPNIIDGEFEIKND